MCARLQVNIHISFISEPKPMFILRKATSQIKYKRVGYINAKHSTYVGYLNTCLFEEKLHLRFKYTCVGYLNACSF